MDNIVFRGDIFTTDLGHGVGSEHQGIKYCLVVQNNIGNQYSSTTIVIPISKVKKQMPTHVELDGILPQISYVLCEQIRVIDKARLKNRFCRVSNDIMIEVEYGIKSALDIY